MLILEANGDGRIIVALSDNSEIEITITELEGSKSNVVVCASNKVSIVRKILLETD